jgi:hypothetical protein
MARREKIDRGFDQRLDEFERRLFLLKVQYEKYFTGIDRIEPMRERDDLKRLLRELERVPINNTMQKYRYRTLKASFLSRENFWTRNLIMIERGTHPRFKFRADLRDSAREERARNDQKLRRAARTAAARDREERAMNVVYDKYIEARRKCGQSTDISYPDMREALRRQARSIKSNHRVQAVQFRVAIEDGKAKVKAAPVR